MVVTNRFFLKKYTLSNTYIPISQIIGRDFVNAIYIYSPVNFKITAGDTAGDDEIIIPPSEYWGERLENLDMTNIYVSSASDNVTDQDYINIEYWG